MQTIKEKAYYDPNKRYVWLDIMRLFLACVVVLAHGYFLFDISVGLFASYFNGAARIVVPYFCLLTGFYFVKVLERGIWRWMLQVGVIYVIWTCVYTPFIIAGSDEKLLKFVYYLIFGHAHLWYLSALIGGALVLAALHELSDRVLLALALGLFTIGYAIQWYVNVGIGLDNIERVNAVYAVFRNFLFFGFPCLTVGYVIRRSGLFLAWSTRTLWIGLIVTSAMLAFETWVGFQIIRLNGILDMIWSSIFVAPFIFALCMRIETSWDARWLAPLSAELYLVHPLLISLVRYLWPSSTTTEALLALVLSLIAAFVIMKLSRYRVKLFTPRDKAGA